MDNVEQILDAWGENGDRPTSHNGAVPTSVVYEPSLQSDRPSAMQAIAPLSTQIQYIPQPQPSSEKPLWFRLMAIAIVTGVPCFCLFGFGAMWFISSPNRMAGQNNEMMAAIAMTAKPENITITYAPQCNQGLINGQACSFPAPPVVGAGEVKSIQGQYTALKVNQPEPSRSDEELYKADPDELSIAELHYIKASTPKEFADQYPQWWKKINQAYTAKAEE